jgi:uncharacterized caspase-like protein
MDRNAPFFILPKDATTMSDCTFDGSNRLGPKAGGRLIPPLLFLACAAFFFVQGEPVARAETRVAMVIGNGDYQFAPPLKNTPNDANAVSQALKSVGFEVTTANNVNRSELDKALREFLSKVATKGKDTIALIFYAGQGVEIDGDNFLVPTDIRIQREADILTQAVPLSTVLTSMSMLTAAARIIILDTSRSNPFPSAGRSSASVDVPRGSFVAFSTSPGAEAIEGTDANSPFTVALVQTLKQPGLTVDQVFQRVRETVNKVTNGQQIPQEISGLGSQIVFLTGGPPAAPAAGAPPPPPPAAAVPVVTRPPAAPAVAQEEDSGVRKDFELALAINTKEAWDAFLQAHPSGFFADLAKAQLTKLSGARAN